MLVTIQLIIKTEINTEYILGNSITNYVTITGRNVNIKTNEITYKLNKEGLDNPEEPGNSDKEEFFNISGIAWVDENENGNRENNEEKLKDIYVELLEASTGNIVKDSNGNELKVQTNEEGNYKFEKVAKGSYIVAFNYDRGKYRVTEYKAQGVPEDSNSDVI